MTMTLTPAEVHRLLSAVDDSEDTWLRPLVVLAVHTGMRRSELLNLTPADVHDGMIRVSSPVTKPRFVPLSGAAQQALDDASGRKAKDEPRLFPYA